MSYECDMIGDIPSKRECFRFEIVSRLCRSAGMTKREAAIFLQSGHVMPPFDYELERWRRFESTGESFGISYGCQAMLQGKRSLESKGELCSDHQRAVAYFGGNSEMIWEGTAYWRCYPDWYSQIVLWWHPDFASGVRNGAA